MGRSRLGPVSDPALLSRTLIGKVGKKYRGAATSAGSRTPISSHAAGEWQDVPAQGSKRWLGCVDQRRMSGDNRARLVRRPADGGAVYHGILFTNPNVPKGPSRYRFQCDQTDPISLLVAVKKIVALQVPDTREPLRELPQFNCATDLYDPPTIMPLTTNIETITQ